MGFELGQGRREGGVGQSPLQRLLQVGRRFTEGEGADVPREAVEGMRGPQGEFVVAAFERGMDDSGRILLLTDEHAEQFQVDRGLVGDAIEARGNIQPIDGPRQTRRGQTGWGRGLTGSGAASAAGLARAPVLDRLVQTVGIDRLGDMVIHALGKTPFALLSHGVGGHGDDRQRSKAGLPANFPRGLMAVHHRHLNIHQHQRPGQGIRRRREPVKRLLAIVGAGDLDTDRFQQLDRDLLIDLIVLDQQHLNALTTKVVMGGGAAAVLGQFRALIRGQAADHRVPEMRQGDGLGQEKIDPQGLGFITHTLDAKSRHHDDLGLSRRQRGGSQTADRLDAAHAGHAPVHENQPVGIDIVG